MAVTSEQVMAEVWWPQPNDLIGGWCVTNVNKPPSALNYEAGEYEVADFLSEKVARHVADLHNQYLQQTS